MGRYFTDFVTQSNQGLLVCEKRQGLPIVTKMKEKKLMKDRERPEKRS